MQQPYILEASETTPHIVFDPEHNLFEMKGESRPENAKAFYDPIIEWIKSFCTSVKEENNKYQKFEFTIQFDYFSSSSAKYLMNILARLDEMNQNGFRVSVRWEYNLVDNEMKESGEEFEKLLNLPFSFHPKE